MMGRVFATAATFGLAVVAFWSDALGGGHFLNPIGILLLLATAVVWFAWNAVRAGFTAQEDSRSLPKGVPPSMPAWAADSEVERMRNSMGNPEPTHSSSS